MSLIRGIGLLIAVSAVPATLAWAQPAASPPSSDVTARPAGSAVPPPGPASPGAAAGRIRATHGEWRSSEIVGATVYNEGDQSIGTIDDLLVGQDGKVSSAVISVGGFLGIGSKFVEVPYGQLHFKQVNAETAPPPNLVRLPAGLAAGAPAPVPLNAPAGRTAAGTDTAGVSPTSPPSTSHAVPPAGGATVMTVTRIVLPGVTKDSLNSMQSFSYDG